MCVYLGAQELVVERGAKEKHPESAFPKLSSNHHHVGSQMVLAKMKSIHSFFASLQKRREVSPPISLLT
jgi:hypothetical protein